MNGIRKIFCLQTQTFIQTDDSKVSRSYHVKVLLSRFHVNGHIIGFRPQTLKLGIANENLSFGVRV